MAGRQQGQAMVEFVLMLVIILALVVSMIHISYLLSYDYWAQQEARFLAFEQTWVPSTAAGGGPGLAIGELQNDDRFRRPTSVRNLDVNRQVEDQGDLLELISIAQLNPRQQPPQLESPPTLLAKAGRSSMWHRKTGDWLKGLREKTAVVQNAYASLRDAALYDTAGVPAPPDGPPLPQGTETMPEEDSIAVAMQAIFDHQQFGEDFCESAAAMLRSRGYYHDAAGMSSPECGPAVNREFAVHIQENLNIMNMSRGFAERVDWGMSKDEALQTTLQVEVTNQFYSYFDDRVRDGQLGAVPLIIFKRSEIGLDITDPAILRMRTDLRYLGSSAAVIAVGTVKFAEILIINPAGRSVKVEKFITDLASGFLTADGGDASFFLNPSYFPVPPSFGGASAALQNAVMENVLRGGENSLGSFLGDANGDESDLITPLIEDANKRGTVVYDSGNGIIPAARRRFSDDTTLTSRFFLVTQPWHITRRIDGTGEFRQLGTQFDGIGEETEEAVLRRRVAGLWFFPSAPGAFLEAPFEIAGVGDIVAPVFTVISGIDSILANLKNVIFINNPIAALTDLLSQIPLIGGIVPTFPKNPVVRPASYPGSTELRNQNNAPDDRMSGSVRNFEDYVEEQEEYNPPPNPRFDNETFQ